MPCTTYKQVHTTTDDDPSVDRNTQSRQSSLHFSNIVTPQQTRRQGQNIDLPNSASKNVVAHRNILFSS